MPRRIVACGGQQLLYPALTRYVLGLTGKARPKILFVPTASGDEAGGLLTFYQSLAGVACEPSHLALFHRTVNDVAGLIAAQDVVMVGGGNTANMLAIWRVHGFDEVLREAWQSGVVLAGWSAGMICWFEAGVTDSFGPELAGMHDGLGFLGGSACPHYDGEERRRPVYERLVRDGFPPGIALDDCAGAHFVGTELQEVVASTSTARGYRVGPGGEEPLETRSL